MEGTRKGTGTRRRKPGEVRKKYGENFRKNTVK
jgi:hypothetical protein